MNKPIITWHAEKNEQLENINETYYAGSFNPNSPAITLALQVWNNRWGQENVQNIESSKLVLGFNTLEDSKLLEICEVRIDGRAYDKVEIMGSKGYINLDRELSGASNSGTSSSTGNYARIEIRFNIEDVALRNGVKNLFLDLEYLV